MDLETLLKKTSRSLYLSVQMLPSTMKPAFSVAYLLCRYADTIADTALLPAERRLHWICRFPRLLEEQSPDEIRQLTQEIEGGAENPYEKILIQQLYPCLEAFNRIPAEQKPFILEVARSICEGMQIDLEHFPPQAPEGPTAFHSRQELEHYCRLMGGEPGRFWSQLIYHTTPVAASKDTFLELGQSVGDTLQIVNILRDLPQDLRLGRCYFPQEDLQKQGLKPADLLDPANSPRFEPIKQQWIEWGLNRLQAGLTYFQLLPKRQLGQRAAVAWPMLWAADTLFAIYKELNLLDIQKRVKIPRRTVYATLLLTPPIWLSNRCFTTWMKHKIRKFKKLSLTGNGPRAHAKIGS